MKLPEAAEVLEVNIQLLPNGQWFAGIRFKVPNQGGYDRGEYDDMFRLFHTEEEAKAWLSAKLMGPGKEA